VSPPKSNLPKMTINSTEEEKLPLQYEATEDIIDEIPLENLQDMTSEEDDEIMMCDFSPEGA
jgi:hypothetical protein